MKNSIELETYGDYLLKDFLIVKSKTLWLHKTSLRNKTSTGADSIKLAPVAYNYGFGCTLLAYIHYNHLKSCFVNSVIQAVLTSKAVLLLLVFQNQWCIKMGLKVYSISMAGLYKCMRCWLVCRHGMGYDTVN